MILIASVHEPSNHCGGKKKTIVSTSSTCWYQYHTNKYCWYSYLLSHLCFGALLTLQTKILFAQFLISLPLLSPFFALCGCVKLCLSSKIFPFSSSRLVYVYNLLHLILYPLIHMCVQWCTITIRKNGPTK